jgi:hypothetical protein
MSEVRQCCLRGSASLCLLPRDLLVRRQLSPLLSHPVWSGEHLTTAEEAIDDEERQHGCSFDNI